MSMGWKDIEKKFFESLPEDGPENKKTWVRRRVRLVCENDLEHELMAYPREEIIRMFPKWVKVDGGERLSLNDSGVLRTFVWQIRMMIKAGIYEPINGNLRTFWYKYVEPFYVGKDFLESDIALAGDVLSLIMPSVLDEVMRVELPGVSDGMRRLQDVLERGAWDYRGLGEREQMVYRRILRAAREKYIVNEMTEVFDDFVKAGIFRFQDDFGFLDPRESWRVVGKRRPRVIFFTEKEGLWWLCEHLSRKYRITVIASQGESSLLALEFLIDRLKKKKVKSVVIIALTDYDPWGFLIADNFEAKLAEGIFFGKGRVDLIKLTGTQDELDKFFTPEQIEEGKRDLRLYSRYKQSQVRSWMEKTHGINKEPYGIHIDLAERERVKVVVEAAIEGVFSRRSRTWLNA